MGYHSPGTLKKIIAVGLLACLFIGFSEECFHKCFCNKPGNFSDKGDNQKTAVTQFVNGEQNFLNFLHSFHIY